MERTNWPLIMNCRECGRNRASWSVMYARNATAMAGGRKVFAFVECERCGNEWPMEMDADFFLDAILRFQERVYSLEAVWHDDVRIMEHFYD